MSLIRRTECAPTIYRRAVGRRPWGALYNIDEYINQMLGDFGGAFTEHVEREWRLAVDLSETDEAYIIEADMPGVDKDEVNIELLDDVVTIKGERKSEKSESDEKRGYHRAERSYGGFTRTFRIPDGFKTDDVSASFENGVLRVTLPKPETAKPKRVSVTPN